MPNVKCREIIGGCYVRECNVWVDKRLSNCPYGQCGVRFNGNNVTLYSYSTPVLEIVYDTENEPFIRILFDPSYSMTTIKHVIAFLREYADDVSYQDVKHAYKRGCELTLEGIEFFEYLLDSNF